MLPWFAAPVGRCTVVITLNVPSDAPAIGSGIDFLIGYGDITVFMHDVLYGVRDGVVETEWPIAGRGKLQ